MPALLGSRHRSETRSLQTAGLKVEGDGMEFLNLQMGRGSSGLFTKTWHAGVTGPPWSTSEVSLGQTKGSVLHPAGEDSDGTHYPEMRSWLEV